MHNQIPRTLSYDERKAAEAAFRGLPCDPHWSAAARAVYDGILRAAGWPVETAAPAQAEEASVEPPTVADQTRGDSTAAPMADVPRTRADQPDAPAGAGQPSVHSREDAIAAGLLIDVTPQAASLGFPLPVGMTKPFWRLAITASESVPEDEYDARLRDVLVALRLRLATMKMTTSWIEFPALLSFPPEPTPQVCVLQAVAQGQAGVPHSFTLALREEIATIVTPSEN